MNKKESKNFLIIMILQKCEKKQPGVLKENRPVFTLKM